jgi:hypothetical protein
MDIDHDLGKIYNNLTNIDPGSNKLTIEGTAGVQLPAGTTTQRPSPSDGVIRRNTETGYVEVYSNATWVNIKEYSTTGLPAGGVLSDVLIKASSADYDAYWGKISADMAPAAKQLIASVKNDYTSTILKGTPVYQTGNAGSSWTLLVRPADAADPTKMPAIGVLAQDLEPEEAGDLIVLGEIRDVNTSAFTEGDLVYIAPGGGYTNIKPTSVNHAVQFLGIVTKIHATNGGGYVTGTGTLDLFRTDLPVGFHGWNGTNWVLIDESISTLSDVQLNDLQTGQYLSYNGSTWINVTGTSASTSHAILTERSSNDQHPISAITGLQSALDGKAQSGNNSDIISLSGITGGVSTVDYVDFDIADGTPASEGRLTWNPADGTLNVGMSNGEVVLQVGQEELRKVYNNGSVIIPNGFAVAAVGVNGSIVSVEMPIASNELIGENTIGVVTQDIPVGGYGYCTVSGYVRDINTSDLSQGEIIYLHPTIPGKLTSVKPSEPTRVIELGRCMTQNATTGIIHVRLELGKNIEELCDVSIGSVQSNNDFLLWNGTNLYWENKPVSTIVSTLGIDQKADINHTHDLSDLNQSSATTGQVVTYNGTNWIADDSYIPTPSEIGTLSTNDILPYVSTVYKDACGFPNRSDTSISFDKTTRLFTLTPLNSNACVYYFGTKYEITSPLTITWSDINGDRFINFDPTTQSLVESFSSPDILGGQILVAYIYWNATFDYMVIGGDERHGSYRDIQWHYTQHRDVGAVWRSGGSISFTIDDDSAVTIGVSTPITIADEDIEFLINHNSTPNFPVTLYEQILNSAAELPVIALIGNTYLEYPATSTLPWKVGTARAQYNLLSGGLGSLADASDNSYINYWLVATTDGEYPIKLIMGRTLYATEEEAIVESLAQYGIPFDEMVTMYRITLHVNDTYTGNSAHVQIANVSNVYKTTTDGTAVFSATSHDTLINRNIPDQHPIGSITGLQSALDGKQSTLISGTNIQSINNSSILTSGNLSLQPTLISGTNIKTIAGFDILGSGDQPISLTDLSDVLVTTPSIGQTIVYDGTNWINLGQTGGLNGGGAAKRIWSNNIAPSSGTTTITPSTTPPLVTAGTQLWTVTFTPYSTAAAYVIQSNITVASSVNNANLTLALFRDNIYIGGTLQIVSSGTNSQTLSFSITDIPNTTAPITYQVRVGTTSGTWYVNRRSAEITYGGYQTGWVMWEY